MRKKKYIYIHKTYPRGKIYSATSPAKSALPIILISFM